MSLRHIKDELKALRAENSNPRMAERMSDADRRKVTRQICYLIAMSAAADRGNLHALTEITPYQRAATRKFKEMLCQTESGRQVVAKLEGMVQ